MAVFIAEKTEWLYLYFESVKSIFSFDLCVQIPIYVDI